MIPVDVSQEQAQSERRERFSINSATFLFLYSAPVTFCSTFELCCRLRARSRIFLCKSAMAPCSVPKDSRAEAASSVDVFNAKRFDDSAVWRAPDQRPRRL